MIRNIYVTLILALNMAGTVYAKEKPDKGKLEQQAMQWQQQAGHSFTENRGQFTDQDGRPNRSVKYLLHLPGLNVQLRATGFSYDTWVKKKSAAGDKYQQTYHRVDIELDGANPAAILLAAQPQGEAVNVFNERGTFQGIRNYKKVTYQDIYPGIDLEFVASSGTDKPVEYNFIVHPGADASQIRMRYKNGSRIDLKNGVIEMDMAFGKLRERIPASYTEQDGQSLAVRYQSIDEYANIYAFNVPGYDRKQTLVIDPTPSLVWSTYYGGSNVNSESINGVDIDASGNVYVMGHTYSADGIATSGTYQSTVSTGRDLFAAKFTAAGVRLWGTYYGGTGLETSGSICVSGTSVYIVGNTVSTGLSSTGAHQQTVAGSNDGILVKLDGANGARTWATYYGGTGNDNISALAVDAAGNVYIGGSTPSTSTTGIATTGALQTAPSGTGDAFVAKFNTNGVRQWGSYIGGPGTTDVVFGIAVDATGNVYLSGHTNSTAGIAAGTVYQSVFAGGATDMFLMKLNSSGTAKLWGTYWGGDGGDLNRGLLIGPDGNLVTAGFTGTAAAVGISNGLASAGAYQTTPSGERDLAFGKFTPDGARVWSTYYGGEKSEFILGFDLDENGNVLIAGDGFGSASTPATSVSTNLATNCSYQTSQLGANESFIAKLSADGTTRIWGTYFGTTLDERCYGIRYAGNGNFYIGGYTEGTTLSTPGSHQAAKSTGDDGFLAKFNEGFAPSDVKVTASTVSPTNQTSCVLGIPNLITGNAVSLYNPPGFASPIFYQWQVADAASGPWSNLSGEVFKDLQPLASQTTKYYRRLIQINDGFCDKRSIDSSATATVLINANIAPIANANGPQWYVCGTGSNTVTLNGSATGGGGGYTYRWFAGSNLATSVRDSINYTPAVTATTTYTLRVTDNRGCVDIDQVTVVPVVANAGADATMCQGGGGVQIGTPGIPGGAVTYAWTTVSGSAAATSLSCTSCAQPIANPTANTTYRLTTTVTRKGGATCTTTDDVVVTFVATPTGGVTFGGTDKAICKNSPVTLGGSNDAAATYSWAPTSFLSASDIYNPVFNAGTNKVICPMVYTVTASKSGCVFTDQVSVNVVDPATSMDGQTISCQAWSSGNTNNCSGATYSWQLVSGPGVVPTGTRLRNSNADAYLVNTGSTNAVYRRVTTLNGITCNSENITISPCGPGGGCPVLAIKMLTPQGCPKVFGEQEVQLFVSGINAADYNFSWTPANIMDNAFASTVNITTAAATTVNVTVTNKYTGQTCTAPPFSINNPAWSIPVLNVSDKYSCAGVSVAIGEPAASGFTYAWSPATGLSSSSAANPTAIITAQTLYTVSKTDNVNGCRTTAQVRVNTAGINFDAGNNRAVCNGATVTLGTLAGGNYTYSWTPVNAAWANGTGPTNANPQVLFASSTQTFNVTVTDPVSGCQKTDAVTLSGTVTPGVYAGPAIGPLCPGTTAQLGKSAELNATYAWTPSTGLSCTNCSNPVVTAGNATQAYSVTVSYPGCTIPVTDNVTVSVNTVPAVTLTNKTVCPTTPTNIGIGGTGNTATLANVSGYEWTPATNLSCNNCASPNANPVAVTTYTVRITFTNGCSIQRQVTVTPTVQATARPDATICPGGSVVLGSPAVPNVTYAWALVSGTAGSITPTNTAQPTANPSVTSIYRLTATGTGTNAGCTVTDDVRVTVKAMPALDITGSTAVCAGGNTTLTVSPVTPNTIYEWSPTGGTTAADGTSITIMPSQTTTYRITQTDLNSGCSAYKEAIVRVWPNNVTATGGDITVCPASSATMPLTVTPATGNTIAWTPATYLSNPYAQNPVITPQASGRYIATVINNTTNCIDTALVVVNVPSTCLSSDFGDAPLVYENGNPASHNIVSTLRIGAATDAEGAPVSAAMNALAIGDDDNSQINDEEGISFLPAPTTASKAMGVVVNNVLNNTGATAYLVGWIDFNRDGDFNDEGERSTVLPLASGAAASDPVLQFSGFNNGCVVKAGLSYLRIRLTTDTTGNWRVTPQPTGARANGEVEDYAITLMGTDFGDAPVAYPAVRASVNPDLDNNGTPDATGSVWLGNRVDYDYSCNYAASTGAMADDVDYSINDEDGLQMSREVPIGQSVPWTITLNSQGPVNGVQWGMWIDWNADGTFDNFYNGSANTASPTPVTANVTAPSNASTGFVVRLGVKGPGTAFTAADYNATIANGEWEDYIRTSPLPVDLLYFNAMTTGCNSEVSWATGSEHNSSHFEVELSSDGMNWKTMSSIEAAGYSGVEQTYGATVSLLKGVNNYLRLKIVNKDGAAEYSMIRVLRCDGQQPILVWPNPAKTQVQLSGLPEGSRIRMVDATGRLVRQLYAETSTLLIPVDNLANGVYQIIITDSNGAPIETQRLLKQ